ncbi:MAG: alpha/beta hydrolase fold domain-containing protein [Chitinophagales bacterium]
MKNSFYFLCILLLLGNTVFSQPTSLDEIKEVNDILYVDADLVENDSLQRLNLVLPAQVDSFPLLVWIGGGAWSYVNRNMEMNIANRFAEEGIAVASVGHRLSSAVWKDSTLNKGIQHPKHIEDVAAAFAWLYEHASDYGYDTSKIFLGGFSSGGHLAALLSMDEQYLEKWDLSLDKIQGVIPISGTYDVSNYHEVFLKGSKSELADLHVKAVFGDTEAGFEVASPTSYVEEMSVPMLLISENNTFKYAAIFEDKIRETDFRDFQALHIHKIGHGTLWKNLAEEQSVYRSFIVDFIWTEIDG